MSNETRDKLTTEQVAAYFVDEWVAEYEHGWGTGAFERAQQEARDLFSAWLADHNTELLSGAAAHLDKLVADRRSAQELSAQGAAFADGMAYAAQKLRKMGR